MKALPPLQPGDILLYRSSSFVGWAIRTRTWSDVEHVEVYAGNNCSGASRNGIGVGLYPVLENGMTYVLRPVSTVSCDRLTSYINRTQGTPYGWLDLLMFFGFKHVSTTGVICSQWADEALRAAGVNVFSQDYPDGAISPRDYLITPALKIIWKV